MTDSIDGAIVAGFRLEKGDYVRVRCMLLSNSEYFIDGIITALYGNGRAQLNNVWCFSDRDEILEYIPRMKK